MPVIHCLGSANLPMTKERKSFFSCNINYVKFYRKLHMNKQNKLLKY